MHQRSLLIYRKQCDLTKYVKVSSHVCELYLPTVHVDEPESITREGRKYDGRTHRLRPQDLANAGTVVGVLTCRTLKIISVPLPKVQSVISHQEANVSLWR
jgi:hypothetical protein